MKPKPLHHLICCLLTGLMLLSCLPVSAGAAGKLPLSELMFTLKPELLGTVAEAILSGEIPLEGILPEGTDAPEASLPETPVQSRDVAPSEICFGLLHGHSTISDGTGTPEELFQLAARQTGLDFFALTDPSDSMDHSTDPLMDADASAFSRDWVQGKTAAAAVTTGNFLGMFGYEMSWPSAMQIGHIGTFGTPGFQSWQQEPYDAYNGALEAYYDVLSSVPGAIGQFNHPGTQYGTFQDFGAYTPDADRVMCLLEVDFSLTDPTRYYTDALDAGWHVAPVANQSIHSAQWQDSGVRTAVLAEALTEESLLDALRACRAYATQDRDLEIHYTLNSQPMGSRLNLRDLGDSAEFSVTLSDPTATVMGTVEVVGKGGVSLKSQYLPEASGTLTFSLPPESGYYFLRVTQPDGDMALTAPIWVEEREDIEIASMVCETAVPVQREPITLTLELKNGEPADFLVESLEILADGRPVARDEELTLMPAGTTLQRSLTFSCDCVGVTELTARLTGTLTDIALTREAVLSISFHQQAQVTAIAVDGSHGNAGLDQLNRLREMAMDESIHMEILETESAAEQLKKYRFFLISAPTVPFSDTFVEETAAFVRNGGTLILCGQADLQDGSLHSAAELNRLAAAAGASVKIFDDVVLDLTDNGGSPELIYTDEIDLESRWCREVSPDQVYRHAPGAGVDPGRGDALVRGRDTAISQDGDSDGLAGSEDVTLLAWEELSGGRVFAAGCLFCDDASMAPGSNNWDLPYANRTIMESLLGIGGEAVPLSTIRQARLGAENELFRVRGYVTVGTSNPYNSFPGTLYLQDDTGGIAVIPFAESGIQAGTALEVTGYALDDGGNRALKLSRWEVPEELMYLYEPLTGSWDLLLDPQLCGGCLVQVEGTCLEVYAREDGTLSGFLLKDDQNRLARVSIEDYIFNGSDGENDLHETIRRGRKVRAMGLVHVDEYGDTVVRVRNCEEVVWVPPLRLLIPGTGDTAFLPVIPMLLSLAGIVLLKKRPRRGKYQK